MKTKVWIVDDDESIRWVLEKALSPEGFDCTCFENGEDVLERLERTAPDIVISDIRMPGIDGLELLQRIHAHDRDIPVIITTAHSDLSNAVNAYQSGTCEYRPKPFDIDEAISLVKKAESFVLERRKKSGRSEEGGGSVDISEEIVGEAPAMQEVFRAIGRLARSSVSVLISGESGTGKELVAHALHRHSPRADRPFIALNMAAIPKELIESELFGHEKGSFTGASTSYTGRFEQADGGTLFLDEIGDMPADVQTRLLRVLADGQFYRVGGHQSVKVNVRIIAATNKNLEKMVQEGTFRIDLFHRLNVIRIHLPALRERAEDIPGLCRFFLTRIAKELGCERKVLSRQAEQFLMSLPWPGNVRELENVCRWITVMSATNEISVSDLPPELRNRKTTELPQAISGDKEERSPDEWHELLRNWASRELIAGETDLLGKAQPIFEKVLLDAALEYTKGRKQDAAKLLGWGRNTLTRKLHELAGVKTDDEGSDA